MPLPPVAPAALGVGDAVGAGGAVASGEGVVVGVGESGTGVDVTAAADFRGFRTSGGMGLGLGVGVDAGGAVDVGVGVDTGAHLAGVTQGTRTMP
jgi:hypothetical protein